MFLYKIKHSYLIKLVLIFSVLVSISLIVLSTVLYMLFEKQTLSSLQVFNVDSLSQISNATKYMTDNVKTVVWQLYNNDPISKLLYYTEPDGIDLSAAYSQIDLYRNSSLMIYSVYIYNADTGKIYSSPVPSGVQTPASFPDRDAMQIFQNPQDYSQLTPICRDVNFSFDSASQKYKDRIYSFLFSNSLIGDAGSAQSAVMINVSEEWLRNLIASQSKKSDGEITIIDKDGRQIYAPDRSEASGDVSGEGYVQKILKSDAASGYFIEQVNGVKSFVSYVMTDDADWQYVRITPYNTIFSSVLNIRNWVVAISLAILLLSIFIIYFLSRRLYMPVKNAELLIDQLQSEKRQSFLVLKSELLKSLVYGDINQKPEDIRAELRRYGVEIDTEGCLRTVLFSIDRLPAADAGEEGPASNISYAVCNIAAEMFSECFAAEPVEIDGRTVAVIVSIPKNDGEIGAIIGKVQQAMEKYFGVSLTAAVSGPFTGIENLFLGFTETQKAMKYRLYYGRQAVIFAETIEKDYINDFYYPVSKEKQFAEAINSGKLAEAETLLNDMIEKFKTYKYDITMINFQRLTYRIYSALETLGGEVGELPDYQMFVAGIEGCENFDEIRYMIMALIHSVIDMAQKQRMGRTDNYIAKVMDIIDTKYDDKNLSRDSIAQRLGVSAAYLGRQFLRMTGQTISGQINEVRLEHAKRLLAETNLSISDIADRAGFINGNYFYTIFKKQNGITPNDYRLGKS